MAREYTVIIERGETGVLIGTVPSVPGCFTQGEDLDELMDSIRDALALCLDELGEEAHEPLEFVEVRKVAV